MIGNYYRCICLAAFSVRCVWVGGRRSTTTTTSNNFNFQFGISSWHDKHHHQHRQGEDDPSTMHINIIQNTFRRVVMGCPWGPRRHKFIYYYLIFAVTLHFSNCNILTTQLNRPHWSHSGSSAACSGEPLRQSASQPVASFSRRMGMGEYSI